MSCLARNRPGEVFSRAGICYGERFVGISQWVLFSSPWQSQEGNFSETLLWGPDDVSEINLKKFGDLLKLQPPGVFQSQAWLLLCSNSSQATFKCSYQCLALAASAPGKWGQLWLSMFTYLFCFPVCPVFSCKCWNDKFQALLMLELKLKISMERLRGTFKYEFDQIFLTCDHELPKNVANLCSIHMCTFLRGLKLLLDSWSVVGLEKAKNYRIENNSFYFLM